VLAGVGHYLMVFFAVWWAWMNATWFGTSFATDDWLYRVLTILQMAGVLVLAAGIDAVFDGEPITVVVLGYVVMRVAMVAQWVRAARASAEHRRTCLTYAAGIAVLQVLWLGLLAVDGPAATVGFLVLVGGELVVPLVAERQGTTPWHPHHITERFGLFTLIVLGESLLASANAVIEALHDEAALAPLISTAVLALVVTAGLWWVYFWPPHHHAIGSLRESFGYGYAHYPVFAAAGAFSAGVEVEIDTQTGGGHLSEVAASFTVTVPIAVFLLVVWWIALRPVADRVVNTVVPAGALLVLADPVLPVPVSLSAAVVAAVVVVLVVRPPVVRPPRTSTAG
jgi:low temperature requirement protein LtrA